ncbi:MAG: PIG-L family deacetylase, partial [Candidatus Subteraquimicrobiales bacterium]|nr:PIG-L family deacetylase [Candidatus Subteraquimicrobiales bacterium]
MKNILVISPHHDDESIGMGGTIYKLAKDGNAVVLAVVSSGSIGVEGANREKSIFVRETECLNASKVLNIRKVEFMRLYDYILETNEENIFRLVKMIRNSRPDIIYMPHDNETDLEHRRVC